MSIATAAGLGWKEAMLMEISVVHEIFSTRFEQKKGSK